MRPSCSVSSCYAHSCLSCSFGLLYLSVPPWGGSYVSPSLHRSVICSSLCFAPETLQPEMFVRWANNATWLLTKALRVTLRPPSALYGEHAQPPCAPKLQASTHFCSNETRRVQEADTDTGDVERNGERAQILCRRHWFVRPLNQLEIQLESHLRFTLPSSAICHSFATLSLHL